MEKDDSVRKGEFSSLEFRATSWLGRLFTCGLDERSGEPLSPSAERSVCERERKRERERGREGGREREREREM